MNRQRTLIASGVVVVLLVAVVLYEVVTSDNYTTKIQCTDSGFMAYTVDQIGLPPSPPFTVTTTLVTSFTTTTNASATVGHVTTTAVSDLPRMNVTGSVVSASISQSCTYIK